METQQKHNPGWGNHPKTVTLSEQYRREVLMKNPYCDDDIRQKIKHYVLNGD